MKEMLITVDESSTHFKIYKKIIINYEELLKNYCCVLVVLLSFIIWKAVVYRACF
jgi:hypothetical protein